MIYDHTITLIVPLDQLETAKRVSRALDPDSGGYEAFAARAQKDGATFAIYSTPCTASFASQAALLLALPDELATLVVNDYATRWPDLPVPTMEELTALCDVIECYVDCPADGYEPVIPDTQAI